MMTTNNSLLNLDGLSEPAKVLIEKIADATGGVFKPWQIKRVAKANAEAAIIEAQSKIEITELHHRAMQRFFLEEAKKQQNIEQITTKALPQLKKNANPGKIEDDWITNFFDKSRLISNDEMQTIWSKILAGEANNPGTYSKRAVNLLSSLDKSDAQLITILRSFSFYMDSFVPLIFDLENEVYRKNGLNFGMLKHLDSIGVISFEHLSGYMRRHLPKKFLSSYMDKPFILEYENEVNELNIGKVLLTDIGQQLMHLCPKNPVKGFEEYILNKWINEKITLSCPYNQPPISSL